MDQNYTSETTTTDMETRLKSLLPAVEEICQTISQVGLSYGVLCNGKIFTGNYGYRDKVRKISSNEDTLYSIASCTKAFAASACALLVEEGHLEWEIPVRKYVPEINDPDITLLDMLSHRTEYARMDATWLGRKSEILLRRSDLIPRINHLPRMFPNRSKWLYNNWMYALAAEVIQRVSTEKDWFDFMQSRILGPLGLNRTCLIKAQLPDDNHSMSYATSESGKALLISEPPWEESPFVPGGGIRSSVSEMLHWARHLLRAYERERLSSERGHDRADEVGLPGQIFQARAISPEEMCRGHYERAYGMGLNCLMLPAVLKPYGRNFLVAPKSQLPEIGLGSSPTLALTHNGENAGALSNFCLLPDYDAAIVVLGNTTALGDAGDLVTQLLAQAILNCQNHIDYIGLAAEIASETKTWFRKEFLTPRAENRVDGTSPGSVDQYQEIHLISGLQYDSSSCAKPTSSSSTSAVPTRKQPPSGIIITISSLSPQKHMMTMLVWA